jgi:hypothetical protein
MPNQMPPQLEAKILQMTEQYPAYSYIRISQQLNLVGIGTIKGVGKIYLQTVIDANSSHVFAKLYLPKLPMTAVAALNDRVLPFYEEHGVELEYLLTDNGRECCGRPVGHLFELYLAIQHRPTSLLLVCGGLRVGSIFERFPFRSSGDHRVLRQLRSYQSP